MLVCQCNGDLQPSIESDQEVNWTHAAQHTATLRKCHLSPPGNGSLLFKVPSPPLLTLTLVGDQI